MSRRPSRLTSFEARSVLLIASVTLGVAGSAYAQSTAAPASVAADAEVAAAFTKADKNSDGKLSKEEAATLPAVAAGFERADTNKDGTLSAAEFSKAMKM
ncbi:EF-hand domain-containing protein [Hydrogenophaga pseudoflava]|uniref:EF-hand domain-containing protein n=1 Tax=Hydrogenophaga pseudoflava TaxID=47421 RepID=UPI0027E4E2AF|nr:EF-hand domain-containing protein [Hydrogenophaga pseudoflava]MDQ7746165.1 EF-hand domain-containing protein [Hydrogenophaga pseudoflava]